MTPQEAAEASPQDLIQAAALTPSFLGAYQAAPPSIRVGERIYERDAARTTAERCWYLAAVAMQNPRAVYVVGNQGATEMALAYDQSQVEGDSRVVSAREAKQAADEQLAKAKTDVGTAQGKFNEAKSKRDNLKKQIVAMNEQVRDLEARIADMGRVKDAGDFLLAAVTSGGSKLVPYADLQVRLGSAKNHITQLQAEVAAVDVDGPKAALAQAQKAQADAAAGVVSAQQALDSAIATVQKELRAEEDRIAAEKSAQAAADAAERQRQAEDAWLAQQGSGSGDPGFGDYYGDAGGGYIEPEWQDGSWASTDPDAELGEPDYLDEPDLDEMADIYGDEDEARKMAWLTGEPIIGVNTVVSPYSLDRYYEGYDLEQNPVFGADNAALVGGIIAGILAAAPAIINAVAPPPEKSGTSAETNVGAGGKLVDAGGQGSSGSTSSSSSTSTFNIDTLLEKIGLKKTINDAAAAAGGSAGQQGGASVESTVSKYLGTGLVLAGIVWLVRR